MDAPKVPMSSGLADNECCHELDAPRIVSCDRLVSFETYVHDTEPTLWRFLFRRSGSCRRRWAGHREALACMGNRRGTTPVGGVMSKGFDFSWAESDAV